jgi:hypothetical protein
MDTLTKNAIASNSFRMEYRIALAFQYQEQEPEIFETYQFPDGTWLKDYVNASA